MVSSVGKLVAPRRSPAPNVRWTNFLFSTCVYYLLRVFKTSVSVYLSSSSAALSIIRMNRRIVLPSTSIGLDPVTGTMDQVLVPSDRLCDSLTHRDLSRPSLTNQSASLNGKCHSLAPRLTPRCPSVPRERLTAARLSQPMPAPRRARPSAEGSRHRSRWETQRL